MRPAATQSSRGTASERVTLTWEDRYRRRIRLLDDSGQPFLLDLERATVLADGDELVLTDGGVLRVRAADEPVIDVPFRSPVEAAQIAWHLGNRHTPVQVLADGSLRLRADHVLADMLKRLGATPIQRTAPFEPEPGAYTGHTDAHASDHP